jgi:hypothetical protein
MDIFTTALTRVVPIPIKPASLKVKALLKEAATSKLKEDFDHLENHDYYFSEQKLDNDNSKKKESKSGKSSEDKQAETTKVEVADNEHADNAGEGVTVSKDGVKHLDLYV